MKRRAIRAGATVAAVVALVLGYLSIDRCGERPVREPALFQMVRSQGALSAGAARVDIALPVDAKRGGYGFPTQSVPPASPPLHARAIVLSVAEHPVAIVSLDVLFVTAELTSQIRKDLGMPVLVLATHTHSGPGEYDARLVSELAALGFKRDEVEAALVKAAKEAVAAAKQHLRPASLQVSSRGNGALAVPRSGSAVETSQTRVAFKGAEGVFAELYLLAEHPTLIPQKALVLDGDFPARVDADEGVVRLVLQTAGGNARSTAETPENAAEAIRATFAAPGEELTVEGEQPFGFASASTTIPLPDASRLVNPLLRPAVRNLLCAGAEPELEVSALRVGQLTLLAVPLEPSHAAGQVLLTKAHGTHLLSLANGYEGYLEPPEAVNAATGESKLQYFGPEFLERIVEALTLASGAAGAPQSP